MNVRFCLMAILVGLMAPVGAAQEHEGHVHPATGRVPAHMLPAERAGILLLEARDQLEQPETTLDLLNLKDGDVVADVGCGNGYYTLRVAERIAPHGHVFAVDVQQGMLDQLEARIAEAGVKNVYPILGAFEDPYLPPGKIDWILLVDVYHEFGDPEPMLARMREALAPGGKVALLEYRAEQDPSTIAFPIPRDHKMTVSEVLGEWEPAGFRLVERIEVLPAQHIFIFDAAEDEEATPVRTMTLGETANVSTFEDGKVYFSGQPSESDLNLFAAQGIKTVINLRTPEEVGALGYDEKAAAEALGLTYINVPMGRELPPADQLEKAFDALAGADDAPVLMHCASSNRVGTVWALYQLSRGGVSLDVAEAQGRAAGMRAEGYIQAVRAAGSH